MIVGSHTDVKRVSGKNLKYNRCNRVGATEDLQKNTCEVMLIKEAREKQDAQSKWLTETRERVESTGIPTDYEEDIFEHRRTIARRKGLPEPIWESRGVF